MVEEYKKVIKYEIDIFGKYSPYNHSSNISYIETQDLICGDDICHGYIDGIPQFKDGSHPSYESLGRKVAKKISERIEVNLLK